MDLLNRLLAFEKGFDGYPAVAFTQEHAEIPVFAVTLYLGLVFSVPEWLKDRKPWTLKTVFALWNLVLSVFSIIGATRTVPVLYRALMDHGIRYTCCENPENWYIYGGVALWMTLFIWSKIPELIDTVFLVVQKKPVIFLHWFHHTTVLLYCWHAFVCKVAPGLWFASMNFCVHSIMYFYYFLMSVGFRKTAKSMAPFITTAQLLQMVVGASVTFLSARWHRQSPSECYVVPSNYRLGLAMYTSYFVLFAVLFRNLYCVGGGKSAAKGAAGEVKSKKVEPANTMCGVELKGGDAAGFFHPAETDKTK